MSATIYSQVHSEKMRQGLDSSPLNVLLSDQVNHQSALRLVAMISDYPKLKGSHIISLTAYFVVQIWLFGLVHLQLLVVSLALCLAQRVIL